MNEFETTVEIEQPVERVFSYLTDLEQMPIWSANVSEVHIEGGAPLQMGSELVYQGKFLGRNYAVKASCTEFQANSRFATKTTSGGPIYLEVDNQLTKTDRGTRLTTHYRGESKGFFKLGEPIVVRLTRRQFETNAEALKELLEGERSASEG